MDALTALASRPIGGSAKAVVWLHVGPGQVRLYADAETDPAFLVYSGTAFPGWKAVMDGRKTALFCTDGALIGLAIPPGKHQVVLTYAPDMFRIGTYMSLGALATAVALAVQALVRYCSLPVRSSE